MTKFKFIGAAVALTLSTAALAAGSACCPGMTCCQDGKDCCDQSAKAKDANCCDHAKGGATHR